MAQISPVWGLPLKICLMLQKTSLSGEMVMSRIFKTQRKDEKKWTALTLVYSSCAIHIFSVHLATHLRRPGLGGLLECKQTAFRESGSRTWSMCARAPSWTRPAENTIKEIRAEPVILALHVGTSHCSRISMADLTVHLLTALPRGARGKKKKTTQHHFSTAWHFCCFLAKEKKHGVAVRVGWSVG